MQQTSPTMYSVLSFARSSNPTRISSISFIQISSSYTQIAWSAHQAGRPSLACRLLQFEPNVADRLPPLLLMEEYDNALEEAMRSCDEDLCLFTALHIYMK